MRFALLLFTSTLAIAGEFTTSLGDANPYIISAIATDSAGNTYVVGTRELGYAFTFSILTGAMLPIVFESPGGGSDVFVSKLDPNGKLLFTDTFAGKGIDTGTAIALDPSGNIYIAGTTTSNDFPLSKPLQTQPNTSGTGFIIKLTNDGTTILYSTYFGGTLGATSITSLATDSNGNLYLTGMTTAPDFPHTTGMPFGQVKSQATSQSAPLISGAILASISAAGDKILYSGVLSGTALACSGNDNCFYDLRNTLGIGVGVDAAGNASIAGNTNTTDLPTTTGALLPGGFGAFVAKVNSGGTGLSYLTYLSPGQIGFDQRWFASSSLSAIAVDTAGNAHLAGATNDPNFPATPGSLQPVFSGPTPGIGNPTVGHEGFLAKLKPDGGGMVWATYLGPYVSGDTNAQSISIDAGSNVWAVGATDPLTFPNTNGWTTGTAFVVGLNAAGNKLSYSALFPLGTVEQSVALDPSGLIHVAGRSGFVSAIAPTTAPIMKIFDFQNAAGGNVTARISPAEVIAIYGPGIGPMTAVSATPASGFYPKTLAGVQVTINGANIPLLYVSATQINAVVPMGIATNAAATVRVINGSAVSPDYPVWIAPSTAQAFPAVLNQDGTINSQNNPANGGSVVTFYATGWQPNFAPLTDGQVATAAGDACHGTCQVSTGGTVLYGGAAPGIVAGVTQINVNLGAIPTSITPFQLQLSVTGPSTVTQSLWIK